MGVARQGISILDKLGKHEMSPNIVWTTREELVTSSIYGKKLDNS